MEQDSPLSPGDGQSGSEAAPEGFITKSRFDGLMAAYQRQGMELRELKRGQTERSIAEAEMRGVPEARQEPVVEQEQTGQAVVPDPEVEALRIENARLQAEADRLAEEQKGQWSLLAPAAAPRSASAFPPVSPSERFDRDVAARLDDAWSEWKGRLSG